MKYITYAKGGCCLPLALALRSGSEANIFDFRNFVEPRNVVLHIFEPQHFCPNKTFDPRKWLSQKFVDSQKYCTQNWLTPKICESMDSVQRGGGQPQIQTFYNVFLVKVK